MGRLHAAYGLGQLPVITLALWVACASPPEVQDSDTTWPVARAALDLVYGGGGCHWVYAYGQVGSYELWTLHLDLDRSDYEADQPYFLERSLVADEFQWWEVAPVGELDWIDECSDWFPAAILDEVPVDGGVVSLDLSPYGTPTDNGCGVSQHFYTGTLRIEGASVRGEPVEGLVTPSTFGDVPC